MSMNVVSETIIDQGTAPSSCPCGCGGKSTDDRKLRIRHLSDPEGRIGDQIATHRSVDGGRSWFGATWMPIGAEYAGRYIKALETGNLE